MAPYFANTPILGAMKDVLGDHPLTKVEEVRDVLLHASTEKKRRGAVFLVDPSGTFVSTSKISPMELPQLKL